MDQDIDDVLTELGTIHEADQPCDINDMMAEFIAHEFSLEARILRAQRQHKPRRHLTRALRLARALEIAA